MACGGNGNDQTGNSLTTTANILAQYSYGSSGYGCVIYIKFIAAVNSNVVKWNFPRQSNARGSGMLYKIE